MTALRRLVLVISFLCFATALCAEKSESRGSVETGFRDWLEAQVWPEARAQGVPRAIFDRALTGVELDWSLPDLAPPGRAPDVGAQKQPEFSNPGDYFAEKSLAGLTSTGRVLLEKWASTLNDVERRYGVPREIVVAIWGRESAFGRATAIQPAFRVLSTQAFMGRRKALYFPELIAALRIVAQGHVTPEDMRSSWAGAMGQPQFLPSKVLRYAVDQDGDGRADIWNSVPDTLASIANYLGQQGWRSDRGWGFEVVVPAAVSCTLEGPGQGKPLGEWERLGVKRAGGGPVAGAGEDGPAFLLMPAGRLGPAFLVSENFYVLKRYNESDLYALFIGHVADRLRGPSAMVARWTRTTGFTRADVRAMQERLRAHGHDVGRVDGLVGFATRVSIGRWQRDHDQPETCFASDALIRAIQQQPAR